MTWLIFESSPWLLPVLFFIVLTLLIEVPFRLRGLLSKSSTVKTGDWDVVQVALFTLASLCSASRSRKLRGVTIRGASWSSRRPMPSALRGCVPINFGPR